MTDLQARDFTVLCSVHEFFLNLLCRQLHHEIPLPAGLQASAAMVADAHTGDVLRRWLNVLDLAITPPMVRDALATAGPDTAGAVLAYYAHKPEHVATDRDKTDFVVTWLYRHPVDGREWENGAFEKRVFEIVGEPLALPEEHRQLVREFEFIREEVDDVRHFDGLVDSSMVQRVRDIKASFGKSFYHPTVLATVASYNVDFGKKFDELFKEATRQIKAFAQNVQQQGGSVMTRVEGDVTVKNLEDMEDQKILKTDYREAQEQFRKVSKFKKAVDSKRKSGGGIVAPAGPAVEIRTVAEAKGAGARGAMPHDLGEDDRHATEAPGSTAMSQQMEDGKLRQMYDSIRNFVRAADPSRAQVVPMRHGNVVLAPHELEAYRVDYVQEKSFRADFANTLMRIVACGARVESEMVDFASKQQSAYLWKPHADALTNLVRVAQELSTSGGQLALTAQQRGLGDKANGMTTSIGKLMEKVQVATARLAQIGSK